MDIGIASENRPGEKRVILLPDAVKELTAGHAVCVERSAGLGIGIDDAAYERAGAIIVGRNEVYSSSLVVRLKEPAEEELVLMKPDSWLMSMLHLPGNPVLRSLLQKYRINAIAMEELKDPLGRRKIEALEQTGLLGMKKGFELWGGDPARCTVKVMGYGNVAYGAIKCAARKFARVIILHKRDFQDMGAHIPTADILVNAINWPLEKRGKEFLITRDMLRLFREGAVIVDLISNPPGHSPIETMHPTTIDDIAYEVDGVIHASCWGWPGLDPKNISRRYSLQTGPIVNEVADRGFDDLPDYVESATSRCR